MCCRGHSLLGQDCGCLNARGSRPRPWAARGNPWWCGVLCSQPTAPSGLTGGEAMARTCHLLALTLLGPRGPMPFTAPNTTSGWSVLLRLAQADMNLPAVAPAPSNCGSPFQEWAQAGAASAFPIPDLSGPRAAGNPGSQPPHLLAEVQWPQRKRSRARLDDSHGTTSSPSREGTASGGQGFPRARDGGWQSTTYLRCPQQASAPPH